MSRCERRILHRPVASVFRGANASTTSWRTLMDMNRRNFIVVPAATWATSLFAAEPIEPWQRKICRLGQTNMTEHDPAVLDVEQWADYWASLKVDAVMVSVTGILADR